MKYIGEFKSIDNRDYRIEIEVTGADAVKTLKLSGTPFKTSIKGDGKHVYAPIRCGGATIGLLSESIESGLYSSGATKVRVTFYEGSKIEWAGFVSPTCYDQGYDEYLEEIDIDCVDGIAVLKDIPFRMNGNHQVLTFGEIIFKCLKESGVYSELYVSDNVQLHEDERNSPLDIFRIATRNFEKDRKDVSQTEDDVAWSCYDVLYEICQWLGYTLITEGDKVYLIDYDAIKASRGKNVFMFRYSLTGSSLGSASESYLSGYMAISGTDYAENGTKISLDKVYNKVSIKDEFNTYDNLFPTFGDIDYEKNLTAKRDDESRSYLNWHIPDIPDKNFERAYVRIIRSENWRDEHIDYENEKVQINIFRFYDSPVFKFNKYARTGGLGSMTNDESLWGEGKFKFDNISKALGGFYFRHYSAVMTREAYEKNTSSTGEDYKYNYPYQTDEDRYLALCNLVRRGDLSNLSLKPYILLLNTGEFRIGPGDGVHLNDMTDNERTKQFPFVSLKQTSTSAIFGGKNHILRIKGKIRYHNLADLPFPLELDYTPEYTTSKNSRKKCADDKKYAHQGFIWCKVRWGKSYWNGLTWQNTDTWFKLYFWDQYTTPDYWKNKEHFNKDFNICKNPNSIFPGEEGYIIEAPSTENLEGEAEIAFATRDMCGDSQRSHWGPKGTLIDNFYCRTYSDCVFISDLSITAEVSPGLLSDVDLDSDTIYTNVVNEGAVEKMNEITFKVCTDDGKKPSYSSVDTLSSGYSGFVKTTVNKALRELGMSTMGSDGELGRLRQEEHAVFKLATHFQIPKFIFSASLHNLNIPLFGLYSVPSLGGRSFVMTEKETDYRFNQSAIKLTEL